MSNVGRAYQYYSCIGYSIIFVYFFLSREIQHKLADTEYAFI